MNLTDIALIRLNSQHLAETKLQTVKDIAYWMGAMQAQDYAMVKWALGVRLPDPTDQVIETAINNGEIIRTHLLRPTWHIVSAADLNWMLVLTAPQIKAALKLRHKELELSETIVTTSQTILSKVLSGGKHLSREQLLAEFGNAHIATDNNRAYHLLLRAELDGIVCSGATIKGKPTYALLAERVPQMNPLTREDALATLARRYFTSHGPATLQDFVWWSGLSVSDAKHALEMVKAEFISETFESQTYWLTNGFSIPKTDREYVYFLPAFDELLISYKDRRAALPFEHHHKAVSNNGIFRPVIVVNGQVIGIWKRTIKKDTVIVAPKFFKPPTKTTMNLIEKAARQFGQFLDKQIELQHNC